MGEIMSINFLLIRLLITLLPILVWLLLSVLTLFAFRGRRIEQTAQVLWVLAIVAVPYLGALAYWIVMPGERRAAASSG
jgi:hypothetical protein